MLLKHYQPAAPVDDAALPLAMRASAALPATAAAAEARLQLACDTQHWGHGDWHVVSLNCTGSVMQLSSSPSAAAKPQ